MKTIFIFSGSKNLQEAPKHSSKLRVIKLVSICNIEDIADL